MSEKKGLESIVPPLELCKLIPADDKLFQQTALAWVLLGKDWPTVLERERLPKDRTGFEVIPAPTLAEIMNALSEISFAPTVYWHPGGFWDATTGMGEAEHKMQNHEPLAANELIVEADRDNPTTAALRL